MSHKIENTNNRKKRNHYLEKIIVFINYLKLNKDNHLIFEYPKTDRLITNEKNNFFDS